MPPVAVKSLPPPPLYSVHLSRRCGEYAEFVGGIFVVCSSAPSVFLSVSVIGSLRRRSTRVVRLSSTSPPPYRCQFSCTSCAPTSLFAVMPSLSLFPHPPPFPHTPYDRRSVCGRLVAALAVLFSFVCRSNKRKTKIQKYIIYTPAPFALWPSVGNVVCVVWYSSWSWLIKQDTDSRVEVAAVYSWNSLTYALWRMSVLVLVLVLVL